MALPRHKSKHPRNCNWFSFLTSYYPVPIKPGNINPDEIVLDAKIGGGSFGKVFHGTWQGKEVAVKKMLYSVESREKCDMERKITKKLTKFNDPHFVKYYGHIGGNKTYLLVLEYVKGGTLAEYIQTHDAPSWEERIELMRNLAGAVALMHLNKIIYCDLKDENILIDGKFPQFKFCDFGLARKTKNEPAVKGGRGTLEYAAPELIEVPDVQPGSPNTEASDIYSLAMTMWTIASWRMPYASWGTKDVPVLMTRVIEGHRPRIADSCPDKVAELITLGWAHNPRKRPTAATIYNELDSLCVKKTNSRVP